MKTTCRVYRGPLLNMEAIGKIVPLTSGMVGRSKTDDRNKVMYTTYKLRNGNTVTSTEDFYLSFTNFNGQVITDPGFRFEIQDIDYPNRSEYFIDFYDGLNYHQLFHLAGSSAKENNKIREVVRRELRLSMDKMFEELVNFIKRGTPPQHICVIEHTVENKVENLYQFVSKALINGLMEYHV